MSKIKYPVLKEHRVVCFHYNPYKTQDAIVLQVPSANFTDSNTYSLRFDSARDVEYLIQQKNGLKLYDAIRLYGRVAYMPQTGECKLLEEDYAPVASGLNSIIRNIERVYKETARRQTARYWKISALRHKKS